MVIHDQGIIWHGRQEGQNAEGVKVTGSRNVRDRRTPCKGMKFPLVMRQETVAALSCSHPRCKCLGTNFGHQSWVWECTTSLFMPHLCRLLIEPLLAGGLFQIHCSLFYSILLYFVVFYCI